MSAPRAEAPAEASRAGHVPALDGVRGLAILLVLLHRFNLFGETTLTQRLLGRAADLGWVGVQLFFVLSGFLITKILLEAQGSRNYFTAFYGRRVLRIFPLYYAALFVGGVVVPLLHAAPLAVSPWLWFFLSNWRKAFAGAETFPHFWSLAVEEQFYLLWPLLVRALGARRLFLFCGALIAAAFFVRVAALGLGVDPELVYTWTPCRMDALASGAMVAALAQEARVWRRFDAVFRPLTAAVVGLAGLGFALTRCLPRTSLATQTIGYSLLCSSFAWLIAAVVRDERRGQGALKSLFSLRPLRAFGKYSYAMYVFHTPIHHGLVARFPRLAAARGLLVAPGLAYIAVGTSLCFAAGFASYHCFERRFLDLKPRYFARVQ